MVFFLNLFSMFDPTTSLFSLNWVILGFVVLFPFYKKTTKIKANKMIMFLTKTLFDEMKANLSKSSKYSILSLGGLFFVLFFFNTNALSPYTLTTTAHVSINFSFALTMWFSLMLFQLIFNIKPTLVHLVPMGTPNLLLPIMVIIELTSIIIRPITLSVRLTANMIAGHLLMSLLGEASAHNMNSAFFSYPIFMLLLMLEVAVAMIQAYVFMTLISLYTNEAV